MKVRDAMQRHTTTVRDSDPLAVAQQLMRWAELRELPVVDGDGHIVGLISEHDLLRAALEPSGAQALQRRVRDYMNSEIEPLHPNGELAEAAAQLSRRRVACLPVTEQNALLGTLTVSDALSALLPTDSAQDDDAPHGPPLAAIMQPEPIAVPPQATLLSTAARMAERGVRHACVIDSERRVVGILSDRDVRRVIGHPKRALVPNYVPAHLHRLRVDQVMSVPTTVHQEASIHSALALLLSGEFSALPVTDSAGRLRGIVSYIDLLRHLRRVLASG